MGGTPAVHGSPVEVGDLLPDRALTDRDRDQFDYAPIADRIADLCCVAESPVNIAIFSPWGSGKSSLVSLIERRLSSRSERTKLIRYDAWRYGGDALPRNFIAHAARELHLPLDDPRHADLHRGLYENQRRVSLSGPRLWNALRSGRWIPLILVAVALVVAGWLLDSDSVLLGALISTVLLVVTAIIESGKVEVEQSKPSQDEEFSSRFRKLVEWATDDHAEADGAKQRFIESTRSILLTCAEQTGLYRLRLWWASELAAWPVASQPRLDRLVFFVDELDRCHREDIVKTLKALRTFLDADRCVFIVAADRQVVEAALSEVEQSTPIASHSPYYSTAGAYLDKIFQHQISLPPLRSRSLAKFARQLTVDSRSGIWKELVDENSGSSEDATPLLDLVLFTLIPSHVRSPRRIKILLNNFAANVRIARSRLPEVWPHRAREIARLTGFQTEFSDFAEDLTFEPRLPRFLLEPAVAPESTGVQEMLNRWSLGAEEGEAGDPDPFLGDPQPGSEGAGRTSDGGREKMRTRRREELRRYIERTSDVSDLRHDLFYLQRAGLDVGLDNPELAELIEAEAIDAPLAVVGALQACDVGELVGSARLLASMVDDVLGPEQRQVMSALMEAVALLGDDSSRVAFEVASALRTYWKGHGELEPDQLIGALRVAITDRGTPDLTPILLRDQRLWESVDRIVPVIAMIHMLRDDELPALRRALISQLPNDPAPLLAAIGQLTPTQKRRLMDNPAIFDAIAEAFDRFEPESTVEE